MWQSTLRNLPISLVFKYNELTPNGYKEGVIVEASDIKARNHGLKDIRGKKDSDLFPPEEARKIQADDLRILLSGKPEELREQVTHEDGKQVWKYVFKWPLTYSHGIPFGIGAMSMVITSQIETEEKAEKLERQVNDLKEQMQLILRLIYKPIKILNKVFIALRYHELSFAIRVQKFVDMMEKTITDYDLRL